MGEKVARFAKGTRAFFANFAIWLGENRRKRRKRIGEYGNYLCSGSGGMKIQCATL
jgi:hypothetical protein